jgi:hypothetical protein
MLGGANLRKVGLCLWIFQLELALSYRRGLGLRKNQHPSLSVALQRLSKLVDNNANRHRCRHFEGRVAFEGHALR